MKSNLRKDMLKKINQISKEEIDSNSSLILNNLKTFEDYLKNKNVFIFVSFNNEVNTFNIIECLKPIAKKILIPKVNAVTKEMDIYEFSSYDNLLLSSYGILEPDEKKCKKLNINIIDTVITPGVVFDTKGYRIGYGGGFYDKLFSKLKDDVVKIAIGFETQIIPEIPNDFYDKPVNFLITEENIYRFK